MKIIMIDVLGVGLFLETALYSLRLQLEACQYENNYGSSCCLKCVNMIALESRITNFGHFLSGSNQRIRPIKITYRA